MDVRRIAWLSIVALCVLAGCGGSGPSASPQATSTVSSSAPASGSGSGSVPAPPPATPKPEAVTHLTFALDGPYVGWYAPFFAAQSLGAYRKAGLSVQIVQGKGSLITAQMIGNGNDPLGFADASAAATAITKGVPIKVVAVIFQKSPLAVIYPQQHPITQPADLVGKTIGASPGSTSATLFPAFLSANRIDPSKVHVVGVHGLAASVAALSEGKVDGIVNFGDYAVPLMEAKGIKLGTMSWADHGLPLMSESIVVNDAYLRAHPDVVKRFVQASLQGWNYSRSHVGGSVKMMEKALGKSLPGGVGELQDSLPLLSSSFTRGRPLGWSSRPAWTAMLATLRRYEKLGKTLPVGSYYTNAFISG